MITPLMITRLFPLSCNHPFPHPSSTHPLSFLSPRPPQLSVWWFLTFTASDLKEKVHYLNGVQYLYDTIRPDQIEIPEFVLEFDKEVGVAIITFLAPAITPPLPLSLLFVSLSIPSSLRSSLSPPSLPPLSLLDKWHELPHTIPTRRGGNRRRRAVAMLQN